MITPSESRCCRRSARFEAIELCGLRAQLSDNSPTSDLHSDRRRGIGDVVDTRRQNSRYRPGFRGRACDNTCTVCNGRVPAVERGETPGDWSLLELVVALDLLQNSAGRCSLRVI